MHIRKGKGKNKGYDAPVLIRYALVAALILPTAWLAGCEDGPAPTRPQPQRNKTSTAAAPAPADTKEEQNAARIKELCDFFVMRPHDVLTAPLAEGNVNVLAERPGVPDDLEKAARDYYKDGIKLTSRDGKRILDERYEKVAKTCQKYGAWSVRD